MDDPEQARAYAAADFAEPHARFVTLLRERLPGLPAAGSALDLGCGPGDPTLRLARSLAGWQLHGVDGSPAMLALAREAAERAGLAARVHFHVARLPEPRRRRGARRPLRRRRARRAAARLPPFPLRRLPARRGARAAPARGPRGAVVRGRERPPLDRLRPPLLIPG
jgi:SAM-dependent methyltransferase